MTRTESKRGVVAPVVAHVAARPDPVARSLRAGRPAPAIRSASPPRMSAPAGRGACTGTVGFPGALPAEGPESRLPFSPSSEECA